MNLPFTTEQFLSIFVDYNATIWPFQFVLATAGIIAVVAVLRGGQAFTRLPVLLMAALWTWSGLVYHLVFFRTINGAAILFGALFITQAVVLAALASRTPLTFRFTRSLEGWLGAAVIVYALLLYPLASRFLGHRFMASPTFGAPCPVVIFTFGLMLWSARPLRWFEYAIPMLWAVIGTSAALQLGMIEDLGLTIAALAFLSAMIHRRARGTRHVGLSAAGA